MKRKILIVVEIIVFISCAYLLGFFMGQKNINEDNEKKLNLENNEQEEARVDEMTKDFENEGYILKENLEVNVEDFKDIYYVVSAPNSRNKINYQKRWSYV